MTNNMYRVGDYVYIESSAGSPYQIRRIEELIKTPAGNVEAKVMCFFRRRDIPSHLLALADLKHSSALDEDLDDGDPTLVLSSNSHLPSTASSSPSPQLQNSPHTRLLGGPPSRVPAPPDSPPTQDKLNNIKAKRQEAASGLNEEKSSLSEDELHQLRHRELFLTRQIETQPATHIRGKCTVTLLNEAETLASYIAKEDTFFYSLVYDPQAKTLLADKGEIRIGAKYQAEVTPLLKEGEKDDRCLSQLEDLVWTPHHGLSDRQIDQFLVVARSVGTFARALDCSSSVKQPSLHMSAAAASRDITLLEAMSLLHNSNYDLSRALSCLVPATGPLLCRDQMEEWAASEANLFEEALEKYGKDFNDLRQDFLPWKTLKNIIEYYYMWKTTDRYVQQKRVKALEAESKLKQVFIPNYNKPNSAAIPNGKALVNGNGNGPSSHTCEGCSVTSSSQWYSWGPASKQCKLCQECWSYWKKLGGLKKASRIAREEDATFLSSNCNSVSAVDAPHQQLLKRRPHQETNGTEGPPSKRAKESSDPPLDPYRLSQLGVNPPPGLTVTPIGMNGGGVSTPPPPTSRTSTAPSTTTPPPPPYHSTHNTSTSVGGKSGGGGGTPQPATTLQHAGGGRTKMATMSRLSGRPRIISWMDAPDDVYFYSTTAIRNQRRTLTVTELKRAARRPWQKLLQLPASIEQQQQQQMVRAHHNVIAD